MATRSGVYSTKVASSVSQCVCVCVKGEEEMEEDVSGRSSYVEMGEIL